MENTLNSLNSLVWYILILIIVSVTQWLPIKPSQSVCIIYMPCIEAERYRTKPYPMFNRSAIGLCYVFLSMLIETSSEQSIRLLKRATVTFYQGRRQDFAWVGGSTGSMSV